MQWPWRRTPKHPLPTFTRETRKGAAPTGRTSIRGLELMEPRLLLSVQPVFVGSVYVEEDLGSDLHGDSFYLSFVGGAAGTQLTHIEIDGNQNDPVFGVGDVFFDTVETMTGGGSARYGADHAFPFKIVSRQGIDDIRWSVIDGTTRLRLDFVGFDAGDVLEFSIDVDEVEDFDPAETDAVTINDGFDPITSGVEFQGSTFFASFSAPHFSTAEIRTSFLNRYDGVMAGTGLPLPADDANGKRDRSAGAAGDVIQQAIPATISGHVYHDRNQNGLRESGEEGIANVRIDAIPLETVDTQTRQTAYTDANGYYEFAGLMPGTYRLVEVEQPTGYFDGQDRAGTVDRQPSGRAVNPGDSIEEIFLGGGSIGEQYDFGEYLPVSIGGQVHLATGDGDCFSTTVQHQPIAGARVLLEDSRGQIIAETVSDANGRYQFEGLEPGVYNVIEITPEGLLDGGAKAGQISGQTRGTVIDAGRINQIRLTSGEQGLEYDFCELAPVELSGYVALADADGNCFEKSEVQRPLEGVLVRLLDDQQREVARTLTDATGFYAFRGMPPGVYSVVESTPDGLIDGDAHPGLIDGQLRGFAADGNTIRDIQFGSGQSGVNYNFCELAPASLSGYVYHDRNQDGVRQSDEPAIAGASVRLIDQHGDTAATAKTDASGQYHFYGLRADVYSVVEDQPVGWIDGLDAAGTVAGRVMGTARNPGDRIDQVHLRWGEVGQEYNFGELLPGSIEGFVHTDLNGDCYLQENEQLLAGVEVQLLNERGELIGTVITKSDGRFRFEGLHPGTYTLREIQPADYFDGGLRAGYELSATPADTRGLTDQANLIRSIEIGSGEQLTEYVFCEVPPSEISGFVFQDGPAIQLGFGETLPDDVESLRDGRLTDDDRMLSGVVIELRFGDNADELLGTSAQVLPGYYGPGQITTVTGPDGSFRFTGLAKGTYAIYQSHPIEYIDGVDHDGTIPASPVNKSSNISPQTLASLKKDPKFDAIIQLRLPPGQISAMNTFSEVRVVEVPTPPTPLPPVAPVRPLRPIVWNAPEPTPLQLLQPLNYELKPYGHALMAWANTWHLSVIDAGTPRGTGQTVDPRGPVWFHDSTSFSIGWYGKPLDAMNWTVSTPEGGTRVISFGLAGAIPISGDFNGDGASEAGFFLDGQWFIDLNGNGIWDDDDLWAKLGHRGDRPVTGDWDGDGKDDIGIFGLAWSGDPQAVQREPGLPDYQNERRGELKNVPPRAETSPHGSRAMRLNADGRTRSDVVDHVFHYGTMGDVPVAGDFNGDGIDTVGVFYKGLWHLDRDGDGRFTDRDVDAEFGRPGDIPVVGDFDGDGVDEIAVYRGSTLIVDSNHNYRLDDGDQVLAAGPHRGPLVVADFNADGKDELVPVESGMRFAEIDPRDTGDRSASR